MIDKICELLSKPVFLDDSKDPTRLMHLCRTGQYDIRAIYLVRDGRAIIASHKKRSPDMRSNILLWEKKIRECERLKRVLSDLTVLQIRYEDLCRDPRRVVSEILAFSALDDQSEHCLDPYWQEPQHIVGHNSRLREGWPIELRNEWPGLLTAQDLENFALRGGKLNTLYGYESEEEITAS